jgi:hypothetical protein
VETVAIALVVGAAALYLGTRAWNLFKPAGAPRPEAGRGQGGGGCCGSAKAGCPATQDMADRIRAAVRAGVPPRG